MKMNEHDAKKLMQIEKECINRDCDRNCAKCDIVQDIDELNSAYDVVIKALKKQIATKPELWGDGVGADREIIYDMYDCPNCGKSYELDYEEYDYCYHCGQKLDWSDIDDGTAKEN